MLIELLLRFAMGLMGGQPLNGVHHSKLFASFLH